MSSAQRTSVLQELCDLPEVRMLASLTDAELLERFAARREDAAFAVLVHRHGPLVLGVCRRVLRNAQDAEDAFQAAFLILARKARSVRKQQSLASWLYKVAYRIALRARSVQKQRQAREARVLERRAARGSVPEPPGELGQLLDEEVHRLPEKYRIPVLLCYLQGRTNEEAARQLGCPTGTLKVRLLRARQLLRRRLVRRGVALSLSVLLASCLRQAAAAIPEELQASTARAGALSAGGTAAGATGISTQAARLADAALRHMVLARLKVAFVVLLTVLLVAGADGLTQRAQATTAWEVPSEQRLTPPGSLPSLETPLPQPAAPFYHLVSGAPGVPQEGAKDRRWPVRGWDYLKGLGVEPSPPTRSL